MLSNCVKLSKIKMKIDTLKTSSSFKIKKCFKLIS